MGMCVVLSVNGTPQDKYLFHVNVEGDLENGFRAACEQFRRNHPDISLPADGVHLTVRTIGE
jgi:hypothetical protein